MADSRQDGVAELTKDPGSALDLVVAATIELAHLSKDVLLPPRGVGQVHGVS